MVKRLVSRYVAPALVTASVSFGVGCDGSPTQPSGVDPITELPRALTVPETEVVSASNGFAWNLLSRTAAGTPDSSVLVSPLSASVALGMALNGANGPTLDQMRQAVGVDGMAVDALNASYQVMHNTGEGPG